jgi:hypothetical protein
MKNVPWLRPPEDHVARKKRTDRVLQEASNHLHYEFWMLTSLAKGLASGIAANGWLPNALLESFVIHVRVHLEFLYAKGANHDAVIAADYFPSSNHWEKLRPALSDTLKKARIRAHKELAHLTYARLNVTPETKPWAFIEIANQIHKVMDIFLENVPKHLLGDQWQAPQKGA